MYQLSEKRTNAINYYDGTPKDVINKQLAEYQQKVGVHFSDIKGVFEHLLSNALSDNIKEVETIEKVITADFAVILHDNADEKEHFENQLKSIAEYHNEIFNPDNQRQEIKIAVSRYEKLQRENESLLSKEPEVVEKTIEIPTEIPLLSNQFVTTLSEKEDILLNIIAKKRQVKFHFEQVEPISVLAKKMIFNDCVVFDLAGEFYTGLNGLTKKIK